MTALREAVARAIDAVQVWSRIVHPINERSRVQICRYGIGDNEDEIVILKEFPLDYGEENAQSDVASDMRADAAIAAVFGAIREPTEDMLSAGDRAIYLNYNQSAKYKTGPDNASWNDADTAWRAMIDKLAAAERRPSRNGW